MLKLDFVVGSMDQHVSPGTAFHWRISQFVWWPEERSQYFQWNRKREDGEKKLPEVGFEFGSHWLLSKVSPLELQQLPFKSWRFDQNLRRKPNRRDGKRERDGSRSSSSDVNSDFGTDDDYRYGAFHDFHHHVRLYDVTLRLRASQSWQPKTIVGGDVFLAFLIIRVRPLIFCFLERETLPSFTLEPNLIKNFRVESLFYSRINLWEWL